MTASVRAFASAVLVCLVAATAAAQPAAPVLQVQVSGQTVTASWSPVPGATSYRAEAGFAPTQVLAGYELGPLTSFSIAAPQGTYFLRVLARNAQGTTGSNVVAVTVSSAQSPPGPPTGLSASVSGSTVTFNVTVPAGATGLLLGAGVAPGQTAAVVPVPLASQTVVPNVPPGNYYARMAAVGPGGTSSPSNEVQVIVASGGCTAPTPPTVSVQVSGTTVTISWSGVAGAAGYQLSVATSPGGAPMHSQSFGAGQTSVSYPGVPSGTYYAQVTAANGCGARATSGAATITVASVPGGYRTPNPPAPSPPNFLPLPNREAVVMEMARLYPNELRNSCRETGGNNTWLFRLVERLRREDTRWGLNWKRGNVGDMSQDVVTYNYASETDEGTQWVYGVDVIGGHCGGSPGGVWINQTRPDLMWTPGARWTLQPYLAAGYR